MYNKICFIISNRFIKSKYFAFRICFVYFVLLNFNIILMNIFLFVLGFKHLKICMCLIFYKCSGDKFTPLSEYNIDKFGIHTEWGHQYCEKKSSNTPKFALTLNVINVFFQHSNLNINQMVMEKVQLRASFIFMITQVHNTGAEYVH